MTKRTQTTYDGILRGRLEIDEDGNLRVRHYPEPISGSCCHKCGGTTYRRKAHVYCRLCGPRYPASVA
jgi:hypothetical protein